MTTVTPITSRGGRPRDASRDGAIICAVIGLLADDGLVGMSMDDVAAQARTGKATIYRRWSTREQVLAAALRACRPTVTWPEGPPHFEQHVHAVLDAHTRSVETRAALALLSSLPLDIDLQEAWTAGPTQALLDDLDELYRRMQGAPTAPATLRHAQVAEVVGQLRMQYLLGHTPTALDLAVAARSVARDHRQAAGVQA
jgi:AcrR family transcriptional regulator